MKPEEMSVDSGYLLIVEDEIINIKYFTEILVKEGYQIRPAQDGQIALRTIEAKKPDLILMDIKLPDISGIELTKKIKAEESTKNIPVIFLSSIDETKLKVEALKSGGVDYIAKPFQARELIERIRIQLKISRMQLKLEAQTDDLKKEIERRKKMELELSDNINLLNFTQELTKVGSWKYKIKEQRIFWTDEVYLIHGIDIKETKDGSTKYFKKSIECYDEKDRSKIMGAFEKCCTQGITYDMVLPFTTFKNKRIWIRTSAQAIKIDGEIVSVIGTIMDITEAKTSEIELSKYRDHLEELVKERTEKLEKQNTELEHFNELFVNREFRIKELKDKVKELEGKK